MSGKEKIRHEILELATNVYNMSILSQEGYLNNTDISECKNRYLEISKEHNELSKREEYLTDKIEKLLKIDASFKELKELLKDLNLTTPELNNLTKSDIEMEVPINKRGVYIIKVDPAMKEIKKTFYV